MNFSAAGLEVTKRTLKLYRKGRYRRENALLAEQLVQAGTNAGAYIDMVEKYGDLSGRSQATDRAVRELDRLAYIAYVMQSEALFTEKDVAPLLKLAQEVKVNLLRELRKIIKSNSPARAIINKDAAIADAAPVVTVNEEDVQLEIADVDSSAGASDAK